MIRCVLRWIKCKLGVHFWCLFSEHEFCLYCGKPGA